jgi:benzil reductase ((S)-benzoin forming)
MQDLWVITGTSRGLGRSLADVLAADSKNDVVEMGRGLSGKNGSNTALEADFSDLVSLESAFAKLADYVRAKGDRAFARATLINNAGVVVPVARFDRIEPSLLAQNVMVNLTAPILATRAFVLATANSAPTRMVLNVSSGAAKRAVQGWTAYCSAKAGLEMATRVMAAEAAQWDPSLTICSLAPGVVDTPMQTQVRGFSAEDFPERERFQQMKETGTLRDAKSVAQDIISLVNTGRLANGGNHDLRELNNA